MPAICSNAIAAATVTMFFACSDDVRRLFENAGERQAAADRLYVSGSRRASAETHRAFEERFGARILERTARRSSGSPSATDTAGPRSRGQRRHSDAGRARARRRARRCGTAAGRRRSANFPVAGANVFAGYWERPQDTRRSRLPWMTTERAGIAAAISHDTIRAGGVYRIVGRIKELIITGGFNVYPREVEDAIEAAGRGARLRGRRQARPGTRRTPRSRSSKSKGSSTPKRC